MKGPVRKQRSCPKWFSFNLGLLAMIVGVTVQLSLFYHSNALVAVGEALGRDQPLGMAQPPFMVEHHHKYFVFEHIWKNGGTEICALAHHNGWHIPEKCNYHRLHPSKGWPQQDYKMVGREMPAFSGPLPRDFVPISESENGTEVHGVQWITVLRHPFSRSLSHFYHLHQHNKHENKTMQGFFTNQPNTSAHFDRFIPDQQTRWICGSVDCQKAKHLAPHHLHEAMAKLASFDAVLILEDFHDPDSCSRQQMRSPFLLNWTRLLPKNVTNKERVRRGTRQPYGTRWDNQVRPSLDELGRDANATVWGMIGPEVMAALGLHNTMDLQLYGYARKLCESIAAGLGGS